MPFPGYSRLGCGAFASGVSLSCEPDSRDVFSAFERDSGRVPLEPQPVHALQPPVGDARPHVTVTTLPPDAPVSPSGCDPFHRHHQLSSRTSHEKAAGSANSCCSSGRAPQAKVGPAFRSSRSSASVPVSAAPSRKQPRSRRRRRCLRGCSRTRSVTFAAAAGSPARPVSRVALSATGRRLDRSSRCGSSLLLGSGGPVETSQSGFAECAQCTSVGSRLFPAGPRGSFGV